MPKPKPPAQEALPAAPSVDQVEQPSAAESPEQVAPVEQAPVAAEQPAAEPEALPAAPELIKARVLAHCEHGAPNDVIEIDAALAKTLEGVVDTTPAAVAYAESLNNI